MLETHVRYRGFGLGLLTLALGVSVARCSPTDGGVNDRMDGPATYLVVGPAQQQPGDVSLGTVIVLQQQGGKRLRIRTEAGTHSFTPDDAGTGAKQTHSCVPAPGDAQLFFFTVVPGDGKECLLYVDLLAAGDTCQGDVLRNEVVPISTNHTAPDAGQGGAGGTGGAGSTTASTGTTGTTSTTGAGGNGGSGGADGTDGG